MEAVRRTDRQTKALPRALAHNDMLPLNLSREKDLLLFLGMSS